MATPNPHRDPAEDGTPDPVPAELVSPQQDGSKPIQGRAQFTVTMLLLGIAVVAVAIRLSMASWMAVAGFAALVAAFFRTRSFAKWHRCALGSPASRFELVVMYGWSTVLAVAVLAVGLGIWMCANVPALLVVFLVSSVRHHYPRAEVAGLISAVPALLAMFVVGKKLWPLKPQGRLR